MKNTKSPSIDIADELNLYCGIKEPGYAVLIDAAWGAGKTHFIKNWIARRKDTVYLSVYGVSTQNQFEAALLEAVVRKDKRLKTPKNAQRLDEAAKHWSGLTLGLSDMYRRMALRSVPRTIVIDDLERSQFSANQVLGIINDYLEHDGKNIIILSHQEMLIRKWSDEKESFADVKEKVIGQVIPMNPNPRTVISDFASSYKGNTFYGGIVSFFSGNLRRSYGLAILENLEFIEMVFESSATKNLRLLKQSLRDFYRVYSVLTNITNGDNEKFRIAVGSYLALSIAYNGGKGFDKEVLEQEFGWERTIWETNGRKGDEPEKTQVEKLSETYADIEEINLQGLVISNNLAVNAISKGIFHPEFIRDELLKSPYLVTSKENSWRVLWGWLWEKPAAVDNALRIVLEQIRARAITDHITLLHVFCTLRDMEERGVKLVIDGSVEECFKKYVDAALAEGRLSTEHPKSQYSLALVDQNHTGLGFIGKDTSFFNDVAAYLEAALDRSFWNSVINNPNRFPVEYTADPRSLMQSLDDRGRREGLPNYAHIPVLAFTPADKMLDALLEVGPDLMSSFINIVSRRISRLDKVAEEDRGCEWPSEHDWIKLVRDELQKRSLLEKHDIALVQMSAMVSRIDSILT